MLDQGSQLAQQVSRFRIEETLEAAQAIVMDKPVTPAAPSKPAQAAARAATPPRKPVSVPSPAAADDNAHWTEF